MTTVTAPQLAAGAARSRAGAPGLLAWTFALFNGLRIVAYLPTILALWESGLSDQHSLLTWFIFLGANTTMSIWLYEQEGRRVNRAVVINAVNAVMCAAICLLVAWTRWVQV
ncbi:hypothetical protein [Azoarcus olearius]|uniref:Hypothetical membrane protein n=1 Tax=Azoarcus sp. (strain BH72) TaxID=418699 RepID=A1K5Z9_AZOSB|nr:hypothetical protein [Azoarcus olearius]CAL94254.1 hypothetical membrane protein [Azoarcus olearius]